MNTLINSQHQIILNSKKLSREAELLLEAKKVELNLIQENFDNEVSFIESQINQIEAVAKSEWVSTFQEQNEVKR